ncbi:MAG TPA: hypothetical protein VKT30_05860 [Caulobacteraceae bacterium]|nr:hypothetical protein [Caulobacteraceae bacterium]
MRRQHLATPPLLRPVLVAAASALALASCNRPAPQAVSSAPPPLAALPLATTSAPTVPAPEADALPPAPAAPVGPPADAADDYAYADAAHAANEGFGDAPPDYAFDYAGGERPWVWRGDDGSMRIAEPLSGGGERYFYYEPGQDTPYLVRDGDYSYGFDGGTLVVVYGRDGRPLPRGEMHRYADRAGRFIARGRDVFDAGRHSRHEGVGEANWSERRRGLDADDRQWSQAQAANFGWRDYHQAHAAQEDSRWADERYRREAEAARYDQGNNDQQQAAAEWQAARAAQTLALAVGQQQAQGHGGPAGVRGPPPLRPAERQSIAQSAQPGFANGSATNQVAAQQAAAQAQAAAQRQTQIQAQILAQHQAQIQAAQAQAAAQRQGQLQAQLQAQRAAEMKAAQAQAAAQHEAQLHAAQAQAAAQRQAQVQAQIQAAQAQAAAQHQAQLAAQHQAQIQAAQAQAALQKQAQIKAQIQGQQQAQAQAAQTQAAAQRQAQIQAEIAARHAKQSKGNTATP